MSFATLQEAWGVSTFGVEEIKPEHKDPQVQAAILDRTEAAQRSYLFVTSYLREVYRQHGAAGILSLLDEQVAEELRWALLASFDFLNGQNLVVAFLCICALWLLFDALKKK